MSATRLISGCTFFILFTTIPFGLSAAEPYRLEDVKVESIRVEKNQNKVPAAIGSVNKDDIQLGRQQLGIDESLIKIPGIFFQNRYNYSQDLRVSIRGFGSRAAFGIRGVKIYSDGIPATLPDGQGGVDDIDIGSTDRIEVIRGPVSSLYGSASGGVINLYTEDGPEDPFIEAGVSLGDFGFEKEQLKAGGQTGKLNYLFNLSHLELDGFRDHSETQNTLLNTKLRYDIDTASDFTVVLNAVNSPLANDSGGINAAAVASNRQQARDRNVDFDAGESLNQQRIGFIYKRSFGEKHAIKLRNYYLTREFSNKLPFSGGIAESNGGQVKFDRFFFGGGVDYTFTDTLFNHGNRLIVGFDIDKQDDDRKRFVNNMGGTGDLTFDQTEEVSNYAFFFQDEFAITETLELTVGARYDTIKFDIEDRFFGNTGGNESGSVTFHEWNPKVSLLWSPSDAVNIYTNYSTAFETPTTTEFANPFGGGLNQSLEPQTATNYEIGIKGQINDNVLYDVAIFHIDVEDELLPFELMSAPDRTFFENAAESSRDGVEASIAVQPAFLPGLTTTLTYTYSDFEFDRFQTRDGDIFDGNTIPGIPEHQFHAEVSYYHVSGLFAVWDLQHVGSLYANNANTVQTDSYEVANFRIGYAGEYDNWEISPYLGWNNMFDEEYNGNIRINAFGGRFFEPAPDRNFYAGLTMRYNFGE